MSELSLHLGLQPVPASRPRFVKRGNWTRTYYAGKYKDFLQEDGPVALAAALEGEPRCSDSLPYSSPVALYAEFHVRKPKTTKLPAPLPDVDNYAKALLDILQPTVLADDKHVVKLYAFKQWAEDEPCIKVTIKPVSF